MGSDICDNRDIMSSQDRENRDTNFCVFRENRGMRDDRKKIRDWLQVELDKRGHGAKGQLASYLGLRPDGITRMLNDEPGKESREIKANELVRMGEFFGAPPPVIADNFRTSPPAGMVKVIGKVAANSWIDVDDMDFGFENEEPIPASAKWPAEFQYGLVVEGNCLNRIAPNGSRLEVLDIKKAMIEPSPGDLVIVERRRFGGQMIERTAKRLRLTTSGYELWPESTDPAHQEPINLGTSELGVEVEMIGIVLWILTKP